MYTEHWQLAHKPFENGWQAVDSEGIPASYYPSETHQAALLKLRYAVEHRRGAALLAGGSGLGKTMLVHLLQRQLGDAFAPFIHLVFPQMPAPELLALLASELGAPLPEGAAMPIHQSVRHIQQRLLENAQAGRHALIAIDESQLLEENGGLDMVRLLLNFTDEGDAPFTLLLVGETGLLPSVDRNHGLEERLAVKCLLRPLSLDETAGYVAHRLHAAGATQPIFDDDAVTKLFHLTRGAPRQINRLCDLALLIGYAEQLPLITASHVESVSQELVTVGAE